MIAIRREDAVRENLEQRYAMRRILVSRLQKASRGVSRRARFLNHRQFAEEWETYARDGQMDLVQRALMVGPAVAAEAGEGWRASILLSLAADTLRAVDIPRKRVESAGAHPASALDSPHGTETVSPAEEPEFRAPRQADLFPTHFIPQPV